MSEMLVAFLMMIVAVMVGLWGYAWLSTGSMPEVKA